MNEKIVRGSSKQICMAGCDEEKYKRIARKLFKEFEKEILYMYPDEKYNNLKKALYASTSLSN